MQYKSVFQPLHDITYSKILGCFLNQDFDAIFFANQLKISKVSWGSWNSLRSPLCLKTNIVFCVDIDIILLIYLTLFTFCQVAYLKFESKRNKTGKTIDLNSPSFRSWLILSTQNRNVRFVLRCRTVDVLCALICSFCLVYMCTDCSAASWDNKARREITDLLCSSEGGCELNLSLIILWAVLPVQ